MNQITNPRPDITDAGYDFNYAQWNADTVITLLNVPWNNDYRDVWKPANEAALNAYLDTRPSSERLQIPGVRYAPINEPLDLDIPIDRAYQFNYLRAQNPIQPITTPNEPTSYYYFIVDVQYVAPNTTRFILQLDVWQSFERRVEYGNCFIERGHIGIANENAFDDYGRKFLTIPEGLDTGSEYRVIEKRNQSIMDAGSNQYTVLVASTIDLLGDYGTVAAPKINAAKGGYLNRIPSGASYYVWPNTTEFLVFLQQISEEAWVGQGIISITMIPPITDWIPGFTFDTSSPGIPTQVPDDVPVKRSYSAMTDWRDSSLIANKIPSKYRHLLKFYTSPYMMVEITTFTGMPIVAKPENWNDPDATVNSMISMVPPNQRIQFYPYRYNADSLSTADDDGGEYIDFATAVANFPTMAIVNNMASMYMAANANSIAFMNRSADWSQQKSLRGNQTAYDQASAGIGLTGRMSQITQVYDAQQTALHNSQIGAQAILGSVTGVLGGAGGGLVGGPAGAAVGGATAMGGAIANNIGTLMQQGFNNDALALRQAQNADVASAQMGNAAYNRDTNKSLADWAARGDYENTIAGINAKIQDSTFTQPSTSGQVGGETINIINGNQRLSVRWRMIDEAHIRAIGDYWLRYGYAVSQFAQIPASLQVMTKFTYCKLTETYIKRALMPEPIKQAIRGILEKGVTVWNHPDDMGNIDLGDNMPLEGITL